MFYYFSRFLVRLALPIYLKRLCITNFNKVPTELPLIFASNHSDSFFDAVVIGSILKPMYTLTRGDVFKKPAAAFWLRQINLIPVFRGSEGRQYVKNHDITAEESHDALKKGSPVLVFSEGICVNEWKLRPLGKGTARMAYKVWFGDDALPTMKVIPTGVNYEHFRGPGKRVALKFGDPISQQDIQTPAADYEKWLREFNDLLEKRMNEQILTIPADVSREEHLQRLNAFLSDCPAPPPGNAIQRAIGSFGRLIHQPLYSFFTKKTAQLVKKSVFYDSVLFGMLMYIYPVIVGLLAIVLGLIAGWQVGIAVFFGLPLLAWFGGRY